MMKPLPIRFRAGKPTGPIGKALRVKTTLALGMALVSGPAWAATAPSHSLTAWEMFMTADWVVKSVMIGLAIASVATWTVLAAKSLELRKYVAAHRNAFGAIDDAASLSEARKRADRDAIGAVALMEAAAKEIRLSDGLLDDSEGLKERIASRLDRIEAAQIRAMHKGTSVLATIGAVAPFVGLFGTVWGIMNAFVGIAASQTTNLAVVAPGIAEALLATALGLVAAIPAVVIYNHIARQIVGFKGLMGDVSAAVLCLVSRDASRASVGGSLRHAAE